MSEYRVYQRAPQRGMALIASLLLLVVITILGIAMFRSFGLQEIVAGNTREKTKALQASESAEQYAEWWLTENGAVNATADSPVPITQGTAATFATAVASVLEQI